MADKVWKCSLASRRVGKKFRKFEY